MFFNKLAIKNNIAFGIKNKITNLKNQEVI